MGKTNAIPTFSSLVGKQVGVGDRLSTYLSFLPRMIFIYIFYISVSMALDDSICHNLGPCPPSYGINAYVLVPHKDILAKVLMVEFYSVDFFFLFLGGRGGWLVGYFQKL